MINPSSELPNVSDPRPSPSPRQRGGADPTARVLPAGGATVPPARLIQPPTSNLQQWLALIMPPVALCLALLLVWQGLVASGRVPHSVVPTPAEVVGGLREEAGRGRLVDDISVSLFRVMVGFGLGVAIGIPAGLCMGGVPVVRRALLPWVNFFRSISPIAWLGFALIWFPVGDAPAVFLIFLSVVWPVALSTLAASVNVPDVYYRVGRDYGFSAWERVTRLTLPAIMPQLLTALRVGLGLAWIVVVAAEMVAGKGGLGFAISDDRNALRPDLLVAHMIVIGLIGVVLDRLMALFALLPQVRWAAGSRE